MGKAGRLRVPWYGFGQGLAIAAGPAPQASGRGVPHAPVRRLSRPDGRLASGHACAYGKADILIDRSLPMSPQLNSLRVKLFTDGADKTQIVDMARNAWIAGFTTNPSLLKKAGVTDYAGYAADLVKAVPDRHISFEVLSDDIPEMIAQARLIATWGPNVHVKLPVMTTRGEPMFDAVRQLSRDGIRVNVTTIFTAEQAAKAIAALDGGAPACVSIFAGRLADLGLDYRPIMRDAIARARKTANIEIIWASTREVFNVIEAEEMGCHIITAPADILKKLPAIGSKTGDDLALDAVTSFRADTLAAGLTLPVKEKAGAGAA